MVLAFLEFVSMCRREVRPICWYQAFSDGVGLSACFGVGLGCAGAGCVRPLGANKPAIAPANARPAATPIAAPNPLLKA
jgi:hypothetical protein